MEVSYATVSEVSGAPRSSIQRRFPTVELLRRSTLETWLHAFSAGAEARALEGARDAWTLVERALLAHAKLPLPFSLLTLGAQGSDHDERQELSALLSATLCQWLESLRELIGAAPAGTWRQDLDAAALARQLAVVCFGVGPSAAVIGERVALEGAALIAQGLLQEAAARPAETEFDVPRLTRRVGQLIEQRPTLQQLRKEAEFARSLMPRKRASSEEAATTAARPATWDAFLSEAIADLDAYQERLRGNPGPKE